MLYTSIDNNYIKDIKKLNTKKYRDIENKFLIEGEHLVLEAFKSGYLDTLILKEGTTFELDINTIYVSNNVLKYISELETSQPIMGICHKVNPRNIGTRVLALDNIQDPGNLGTIIRSAVAFNTDTILLSDTSVDLYNSKVLRSTQGLLFHLNIIKCNLCEKLEELKTDDYQIIGTSVTNGNDIKTIEHNKKFVIIMGNEGNGISDAVSSLCDSYVYIKMNESCESLNVGVATSIILYELDK